MDPSVLLLLISLGLLVLLLTSRRRQQRDQQAIQSRLAPGTGVMTASGLFATVVSLEDEVVVLETAPGQHSRWDRRAVARLVTAEPEAGDETASQDADVEDAAADDATSGDGTPDGPDLDRRPDSAPPEPSTSPGRADEQSSGNPAGPEDDTGAKDTGPKDTGPDMHG